MSESNINKCKLTSKSKSEVPIDLFLTLVNKSFFFSLKTCYRYVNISKNKRITTLYFSLHY